MYINLCVGIQGEASGAISSYSGCAYIPIKLPFSGRVWYESSKGDYNLLCQTFCTVTVAISSVWYSSLRIFKNVATWL